MKHLAQNLFMFLSIRFYSSSMLWTISPMVPASSASFMASSTYFVAANILSNNLFSSIGFRPLLVELQRSFPHCNRNFLGILIEVLVSFVFSLRQSGPYSLSASLVFLPCMISLIYCSCSLRLPILVSVSFLTCFFIKSLDCIHAHGYFLSCISPLSLVPISHMFRSPQDILRHVPSAISCRLSHIFSVSGEGGKDRQRQSNI